ncbi:MAG: hypothetical protein COC04_05365 [Gammaproteobacteria bacterium]|nr:MAG: hypothetical protein COC04_05365 [Gammaproteobacteria bacterium]
MDNSADISPEMIVIPTGYFPSVSNGNSRYAGKEVVSFELAKYTVTNQLWQSVMDFIPDSKFNKSLDLPVVNVSWFDVQSFLENLNKQTNNQYRLPTELEWEYAARAGSVGDYYFPRKNIYHSNGQKNVVNYDKKRNGTVEVGSLPPNPWGLYEMLGNVWEWVSDEGGHLYPYMLGEHDTGLMKGGCWASGNEHIKLGSREEHERNMEGWDTFGFRIARDL